MTPLLQRQNAAFASFARWLAPALSALAFFILSGLAWGKPNIIFIYTDDQASWTLGSYGNPQAHTPHLDRLAAQGARLTNALVATPVCSPARASLFTSRYGSELGILDFIPAPGHSSYNAAMGEIGLASELVTFPEVLARAGYTNGLVGKWHIGDWTKNPSRRFHPTNHGFHYFMGLTGGGGPPMDALLEKDGVEAVRPGLIDDVLTGEGITFVERNRDRPFFLFLALRAPHRQWLPVAPEDWAPFDRLDPVIPNPDYPDLEVEKVRVMMREYLASVAGVDRNVGRVLATLDRLKLADNTIVIFSSDHGYNVGHNGIYHKGNGIRLTRKRPADTKNIKGSYRPNLYDHSLRVPAIVRWPGRIPPGTVINETVSSLDWYPTLLAMAGAALPQDAMIRGRNVLPLLRGERPTDWENSFYAEYSMRMYCRTDLRSFRTLDWKLVRDFLNPERDELYHLATDPEERSNRISDTADPAVSAAIRVLDRKIIEEMRHHQDPALALAQATPVVP
jgi:uncharacterized sulfatase